MLISNEHENELRKSKRRRTYTSVGSDFITTFLTENFDINILNDEIVSIYSIEEVRKTYDETMRSKYVIFWKETIKSKFDCIVSNHTWDLYDLP